MKALASRLGGGQEVTPKLVSQLAPSVQGNAFCDACKGHVLLLRWERREYYRMVIDGRKRCYLPLLLLDLYAGIFDHCHKWEAHAL